MTINGVTNGGSSPAGAASAAKASDPVAKSIQRQIADAQKKLQELSSNDKLSMEEKMKKRQEIQKQIFDLQSQLRQHEIELRRQSQQAKKNTMDDMLGDRRQTQGDGETAGMSEAGMAAMLSADSSMKQAKVQGSVARDLKGDAKVMRGEMALDPQEIAAKKQESLADLEQKANNAAAAEFGFLGNAVQQMKAATEAEAANTGDKKQAEEDGRTSDAGEEDSGQAAADAISPQDAPAPLPPNYTPVDVIL